MLRKWVEQIGKLKEIGMRDRRQYWPFLVTLLCVYFLWLASEWSKWGNWQSSVFACFHVGYYSVGKLGCAYGFNIVQFVLYL